MARSKFEVRPGTVEYTKKGGEKVILEFKYPTKAIEAAGTYAAYPNTGVVRAFIDGDEVVACTRKHGCKAVMSNKAFHQTVRMRRRHGNLDGGKKRSTLKGSFSSKKAANRRTYTSIASGSPVTKPVKRECALVKSGPKKGKLRKGCRIDGNGIARCDVLTRLPRTARTKSGKTVECD